MKLPILAFLSFFFHVSLAQTYKGTVTDTNGEGLAGVTLQIQNSKEYAFSDQNGNYTLTTPKKDFELVVSLVGFETQRIAILNGSFPRTIRLKEGLYLDELVVTALGIKREKQALSSAVTELEGRQLTEVPLPNLVNSLAGEVAGVQITNGSSGVGSASRIIIRGENSISGNNQPLFVVDGVPVSNLPFASALTNNGSLQEVDYGNGASEISPDDIESISILKGAGSASLYGSRAANGVVLITTKRGKGLGVSFSSSLTVESVLTLPSYQNVYGGGTNGEYSFQDGKGGGVRDGGLASYGPKLDAGILVKQFDSPSIDVSGNVVRAGDVEVRKLPNGTFTEITPTPWISRPDNVRNFFETGYTSQNNLAIHNYGDNGGFRVSYSNLRNTGIMPNTDLKRDGIALSLDQSLSNKLRFESFINYINTRSSNRPNLGYGYENPIYGFNWTGRQANIEAMKDYWQAGRDGIQHFDINYLWLTNPFLTMYENTNGFDKKRLLGNSSFVYDFTERLSLRVRTGVDLYNDSRDFRRAVSTNQNPFGSYREDEIKYQEINTDISLTYSNNLGDILTYGGTIGANRFDQTTDYQFTEASQLLLPGIYSISNSRSPLVGSSQLFRKRINSVFGTFNAGYKSTLFLDLSVRNDWSSTLPLTNNSFAYYSAGVSYILNNVLRLPSQITFLKLRANISSAGNDTDPYQLFNTFQFNQNYGSSFRVTNETVLKNANLKPERLNAIELGTEIYFYQGRLQTEISAYQNTSVNQIIGRPISTSTGFSNIFENGGEVQTKGLEVRVSGEIIKKSSFSWKAAVNFSTFRSIVTRLPEGVSQFVTGGARFFQGSGGSNEVFYIAREGGRVGDMYGTGFVEIDGQILHSNGIPVQDGTLKLIGNYNPDFSVGFKNQFAFKSFTASILLDWRHGGVVTSRTKALGMTSGVLIESLEGREEGIIGKGVKNTGTAENPVYVPNDISVAASRYYNAFYDRGNELSPVYDASYLKLRQLGLYYNFRNTLSSKIGLQNLRIGIIGNNLLLFTENPHFDPELSGVQETNYTYGVEDMVYPSTRSIGISLKTNF